VAVASRAKTVGVAAVLAAALGCAWLQQGPDYNQNSHYVLVRALASGTPHVDRALGEIGELSTRDLTRRDGHLYSDKAPGLAFVTLPVYLVLDAAGAVEPGDPTNALWALGLFGAVLPAALLALLVLKTGEVVEPGFGALAAVALATGTLLLPYSTLLYSHALSALLVFASFAVLFFERQASSAVRLAAAGILAGYAVTTEYPNAIALVALGVYAIRRGPRVARGAAFAAGAAVGIAPLLLYDWWAFGSPTDISRTGSLTGPSSSEGFFGVGVPSLRATAELLVSANGLFTLSPIVACGLAGLVLLYRRALRAEALLAGAITVAYLALSAGYESPFGGFSPGPRYAIPLLPFAALGLPLVFRRAPTVTGGLLAVSVVIMSAITATHALAGYNLGWFDRIEGRDFTRTAASLLDITGWYTIVPFFAAIAVSIGLACAASGRPQLSPLETLAGGLAVLAWAALAANAPVRAELGGRGRDFGAYAVVAAVAFAAALVIPALLRRRERSRQSPGPAWTRATARGGERRR
jgi:hypothetical protein